MHIHIKSHRIIYNKTLTIFVYLRLSISIRDSGVKYGAVNSSLQKTKYGIDKYTHYLYFHNIMKNWWKLNEMTQIRLVNKNRVHDDNRFTLTIKS